MTDEKESDRVERLRCAQVQHGEALRQYAAAEADLAVATALLALTREALEQATCDIQEERVD